MFFLQGYCFVDVPWFTFLEYLWHPPSSIIHDAQGQKAPLSHPAACSDDLDVNLGIDQNFIPYKSHKDNRQTLVENYVKLIFLHRSDATWSIQTLSHSFHMVVFLVMFDDNLQMFWNKLWISIGFRISSKFPQLSQLSILLESVSELNPWS